MSLPETTSRPVIPPSLARDRTTVGTALALALAGALTGCGDNAAPEEMTISALRLLGQQILPRRMEFEGTVVGGLSGIDYDTAHKRYLLISDDRTTMDS